MQTRLLTSFQPNNFVKLKNKPAYNAETSPNVNTLEQTPEVKLTRNHFSNHLISFKGAEEVPAPKDTDKKDKVKANFPNIEKFQSVGHWGLTPRMILQYLDEIDNYAAENFNDKQYKNLKTIVDAERGYEDMWTDLNNDESELDNPYNVVEYSDEYFNYFEVFTKVLEHPQFFDDEDMIADLQTKMLEVSGLYPHDRDTEDQKNEFIENVELYGDNPEAVIYDEIITDEEKEELDEFMKPFLESLKKTNKE